MDGSGLAPFALAFMLVSMGAVTALAVYCYWRILREPGAGDGAAAAAPPAEGGAGEPRREGS